MSKLKQQMVCWNQSTGTLSLQFRSKERLTEKKWYQEHTKSKANQRRNYRVELKWMKIRSGTCPGLIWINACHLSMTGPQAWDREWPQQSGSCMCLSLLDLTHTPCLAKQTSGQIIVFHQPACPGNKGNSFFSATCYLLGWGRVRSI